MKIHPVPNYFAGIPPRPSLYPSWPGPFPLYWRDEQTGRMKQIVEKYLLNCNLDMSRGALDQIEIEIMRQYFEQWINSPAWNQSGFDQEMIELRETVKTLQTHHDLRGWYYRALDIGIDPL